MSVIHQKTGKKQSQKRLDEIIFSLEQKDFTEVTIKQNIPKKVWVATIKAEIKGLDGQRTIAIVMNISSVESATEIDYLITNKQDESVTGEWIVTTFSCEKLY